MLAGQETTWELNFEYGKFEGRQNKTRKFGPSNISESQMTVYNGKFLHDKRPETKWGSYR